MAAWFADFRQDFRLGLKLLRKSRGFTLTAVLTMALGIGATTAIFSVLHSIVLRPLPFPDLEQLVSILEVNLRDGRTRPPSVEVHEAWREQSQTLTSVGAGITGGVDMSVTGPAGATRISLGGIALNTLSVLGVEPIVGRWYRPDEATVEGDTAESLVISYGLWQTHFGGDPDVVGKTVPGWDAAWGRTVIGVMPADFWVHPSMADVVDGSTIMPGMRRGLLSVYKNWMPPDSINGLDTLLSHYRNLSDEFGYNATVPVTHASDVGFKLIDEDDDAAGALEIFEYSLANISQDAIAHYQVAVALRQLGRPHEALEKFEQAIDLGPVTDMYPVFIRFRNEVQRKLNEQEGSTE